MGAEKREPIINGRPWKPRCKADAINERYAHEHALREQRENDLHCAQQTATLRQELSRMGLGR